MPNLPNLSYENANYLDDRMFVLELRRAGKSSDKSEWLLVTRRNVRGYPPKRVDDFEDYETARAYMEKVEPETPRLSLDERPPDPIPTIEKHRAWVKEIGGRQNYDEGADIGSPFFPGEVNSVSVKE